MTTPQRPFELAWIPRGTAVPNPDQYVEHPDHQLDALRGILYGRNAPGWRVCAMKISPKYVAMAWQR